MFNNLITEIEKRKNHMEEVIKEIQKNSNYKRLQDLEIIEKMKYFRSSRINVACFFAILIGAVFILIPMVVSFPLFTSWFLMTVGVFVFCKVNKIVDILNLYHDNKKEYLKLCEEHPKLAKEKISYKKLYKEMGEIRRIYCFDDRIDAVNRAIGLVELEQELIQEISGKKLTPLVFKEYLNKYGDRCFDTKEEKEAYESNHPKITEDINITISGYNITIPGDVVTNLIKEEKAVVKQIGSK